jgi:hypothetical protein
MSVIMFLLLTKWLGYYRYLGSRCIVLFTDQETGAGPGGPTAGSGDAAADLARAHVAEPAGDPTAPGTPR